MQPRPGDAAPLSRAVAQGALRLLAQCLLDACTDPRHEKCQGSITEIICDLGQSSVDGTVDSLNISGNLHSVALGLEEAPSGQHGNTATRDVIASAGEGPAHLQKKW